ncbi:anthranilate phosphoribosyltransferase [Methanofervidicoccus abyssi]|uniref:Anthranilate phosphoribosyltransferase n=1 Tax=Methanofervidicoccus abyssi TaxID=2082189 RepID=A0A401HP85_9EURY|nr:anthranilate phosphoribosyltransferase [Methanofervidicoccus abyssi]GBF36022.1 anthranilate phosphoribosyltransferase [Methanofervidicoccus abyssi]
MLSKIVEGQNLSFEEAYNLFNTLLEESDVRIGAYLTALQTKGVTSEEIAGFARAMRDRAIKVNLGRGIVDTCGTGGDRSSTVNVSTAVSIILSAFTKVAKHGNVSVTSQSGSADVLKVLGVEIDVPPEETKKMIEKTNFVFLFAPKYHPALKKIMPIRRELGIRTIFNILGPLTNPANPEYQMVGVNAPDLVEKVGEALKLLGVKRALVVHGNGLDELDPRGPSKVCEVVGNKIETYTLSPSDFGLERSKIVPCHSPEESAKRILKVLSGKRNEDRNFIVLNASAVLYTCGMVSDYLEAVEMVNNAIDSGKVLEKLEEIKKYSEKLKLK